MQEDMGKKVFEFLLWVLMTIVIAIVVWFVLTNLIDKVYGQNVTTTTTPPAVTPTPTIAPTPTSPAPNLQYLPQKSYIQTFVPEQGVPTALPATSIPQYTTQPSGTGLPTDIMGILAMVGAAGAYLKGHLAKQKADTSEGLAKTALAAEVRTKEQLADNTKYTFSLDPAKANAINDLPSIKLETLEQEKAELAEKAANA